MYLCDMVIRRNSLFYSFSCIYNTIFVYKVYRVELNFTLDLHLPSKFLEVFNNVPHYRKHDFFCKFCIFYIPPVKPIRYSAKNGRVTGLFNAKTKKSNNKQNNIHFQTAIRIYMHIFLKLDSKS